MPDSDDIRNEIAIEAAGSSSFEVEAFARVFARRLEEAEQAFDLNVEVLHCKGPRGKRLELLGYAEDATDGSMTLLAGRYFGADEILTMTEARDALGRAAGFFEAAASGWLTANLEPSSREAEYADYFAGRVAAGMISRVRVLLITDGVMSERIRSIESSETAGLRTVFEVWDQRRVLDAATPERGSEDIKVDFTRWMPNGLPCLLAETGDESTQTYLAVISGRVLAAVFEEYGSLLLESNVRTFLSARGAVNKGIQATLAREPERFLAYNNGLTTTATHVELSTISGASYIRSLDRWQIVNGGQTTASLVHYLRGDKSRNVDAVSVQMKLVTVSAGDSASVVQAVARYANSQNRVSGADLFATHEFHIRMEQVSRRLRAPAREGHQYQTGWYYERARGQWENDRAGRGSAAEQKKFELEYPKNQRITKTDWAKYAYAWGKKPHVVSKGAQSVFAEYAIAIDKSWEEDDSRFGDHYFRANVGKAIMFEQLRSSVLRLEWYTLSPGYLANIVAYAIARFSLQVDRQFEGAKYDFERVWQQQSLSEASLAALQQVAQAAQRALTDPRRPQANVTQWAKQQACWDLFSRAEILLPSEVADDLISSDDSRSRERESARERRMDSGFEDVKRVLAVHSDVWLQVERSKGLSPMERDLIQLFGLRKSGVPSERQAAALLRLLGRMAADGTIPRKSY